MLPTSSLIALTSVLVANSVAAQATSNSSAPSISWFPCPQNTSLPFSCGSLQVPLDYTNLSSGRYLNLSLVKVKATQQPSRGSILFNPGGPGLLGRSIFLNGGDEGYLALTGGYHDLIAFDARGTGDTIPFSCFTSEAERSLYSAVFPQSSNASDTSIGTTWAVQGALARQCFATQNDTGRFVSTAFVARDMMQIVDALGEDGLLRFWGFSYGSALGATVAAMFPQRMDKVIIDGVLNIHQYYAGRDVQQVSASDQAFGAFISACASAPGQCALARPGLSAAALQERVDRMLDEIKYQPLTLGPQFTDIVQYGGLKTIILQGLRGPPTTWPLLGVALNAVSTRNVTAWRQSSTLLLGYTTVESIFPNLGIEAFQGIRGSDVYWRSNNLSDALPVVADYWRASRYIGDSMTQSQPLLFPQWLIEPKERFRGSFQVQTKYPMLLIGNPLDPLTPIASARNVSADFTGSVVLQHNGNGHCSVAQVSECTISAVQAYFINGTLPAPGTQCEPDEPVFSTATNATSRMLARGLHPQHDIPKIAAALKQTRELHLHARYV